MRKHTWLSLAAVACAGGALVGCSSGPDLSGPTVFQFQGLTAKEADVVEGALRSQEGLRVSRKDTATGTTVETTGIERSKDFAPVLAAVREAAIMNDIELKFDSTVFRYSSLTASGSALTTVTIEASRGAQAFVADRTTSDPWRRVRLDDQGRWRGAVQTKGIVSANGGWLYIAYRSPPTDGGNGLFRYARVNVLTNEQEATSFGAVQRAGLGEPVGGEPEGTEARGHGGTEGEAGTETAEGGTTKWKWPWQ